MPLTFNRTVLDLLGRDPDEPLQLISVEGRPLLIRTLETNSNQEDFTRARVRVHETYDRLFRRLAE